ncbi:hypothetical protein VN97_g3427 [Penicillium thymicola]|uniref:Uncharacterized protein n=1 Tax=Penicillium thymicola TaxID=293382 RepID=A0AAI9TMN0_PENTH|nr:hypothetical protein VN97_g3427 [Penicillium thymicola]
MLLTIAFMVMHHLHRCSLSRDGAVVRARLPTLNKVTYQSDPLNHPSVIPRSSPDTATSSQVHYSTPRLPSPAFTVCQGA